MQNGDRSPARSFRIITLGCKVNQYDSEVMRERLLDAGWAEDRGEPDVVVINTCTVTHRADAKARRLIRRTAREHPGCRIAVTGCIIDRDRHFADALPAVRHALPNAAKPFIAEALTGPDRPPREDPAACLAGISDFPGHTRAFVKVQDGCDAWCSYCIVPAVRGRERSRPADNVVAEVARLADRFHEVVLTGIHLGRYDGPVGGLDLAGLVGRLLDETPIERLRLSSIEPKEITPELIDVAAGSPRLCPHFHVPLQSGSDRTLDRMNRPYTAAEFLHVLARVRARLDRPAVTTDVMVGFPGESDEDFAGTVAACRAAEFARVHVFPYSDRPGTAAERMPDKVHDADVTDRKNELERLADELALAYKKPFVGRSVDVLVETRRHRSGALCGYCPRYLRVLFDGPDAVTGRIRPVRIREARPHVLLADAAEKP
ncbi:MAG: tRNA (N(6)-L-threonylcarbamoyladenosine(37)-C(2))-methylthiotransferase MtaB [Planctomycetota bacterium]